jgi:hypothetical protein
LEYQYFRNTLIFQTLQIMLNPLETLDFSARRSPASARLAADRRVSNDDGSFDAPSARVRRLLAASISGPLDRLRWTKR